MCRYKTVSSQKTVLYAPLTVLHVPSLALTVLHGPDLGVRDVLDDVAGGVVGVPVINPNLNLALTVLYLDLTVLYLALTVLYLVLTIPLVPCSLDSEWAATWWCAARSSPLRFTTLASASLSDTWP